jgi:hypothetical protein
MSHLGEKLIEALFGATRSRRWKQGFGWPGVIVATYVLRARHVW